MKDELLQSNIQQAKKGSQTAFNTLLNTFWSDVYNYHLKKTGNENDAEDITVRTFSKAFDKLDTFDENFKFKTWLIAISKNIQIDLIRKKNNSPFFGTFDEHQDTIHSVIDSTPSAEDIIIIEQNLAKLLRDIKKLKPKYQEVIQLRYFQELSYKEIAHHLNEPMSNVKVKLLRAKKILADILIDT